MSSYEPRTPPQVRLDNIILKYRSRHKDIIRCERAYDDGDEFAKQLNLIILELDGLKIMLDKEFLKGGK